MVLGNKNDRDNFEKYTSVGPSSQTLTLALFISQEKFYKKIYLERKIP